jgi:ribosome-associated translation inhibitor RaiA
MKIVIQALDLKVSNELRLFIEICMQKIEQFPITIVRAEFILGDDRTGMVERKFCNVRLTTTGSGYLVSQYGHSSEEAIATAITELSRKIRKDTGTEGIAGKPF